MYKLVTAMILSLVLSISGCATTNTGSDTETLNSPSPYAGTYTGTETFESGIYPITIQIKANGKVQIIDVDNISAQGQLEDNTFIVKRYGSSPMVFEGTITDTTISGITHGNRFLGDGTFTVTLE